MASLKDFTEGRRDLIMVDPRKLQVKAGFNVRQDSPSYLQHIAELKESIRENGIKTPLEVFIEGDALYVSAGHTRLRSVMELIAEGVEIKTIPCLPEAKGTSEVDRTLNLIVSNSGKPLEPIEQAEVFKRLLGYGWTNADIARKTGYSQSHIGNCIALAAAPEAIKDMVRNEEVSATLATEIVKEQGAQKAVETLAEAKATADGKKITKKHLRAPAAPAEPKAKEDRKATKEIGQELAFCADRLIAKLPKDRRGFRAEFDAMIWALEEARRVGLLPEPKFDYADYAHQKEVAKENAA